MKFLKTKYFPILLLALCILLPLSGCIHNDIPYPRIPQDITAIAAEGESSPASIDADNYQVTLYLDETTDPKKVRFTQFEYTEGATPSCNLLEGEYDLSKPLRVTLSLYQDYQWVITATQEIERYFNIRGQVGQSVIDPVGHRVIVRVPMTADLKNLYITGAKLGPKDITTTVPELTPGYYDIDKPLKVSVTYFGETSEWTVYVERTRALVTLNQVDAWAQVIWAYADGQTGADNRFQYRKSGDADWIDVPDDWVTHDGGSFSARIIHLTPLTKYEVRALSDDSASGEVEVETESTMILPDGSFDQWWLENNKIWNPWNQDGIQYWDTGNRGAATLGQSNVTPSDHTPDGQGKAAKLETRFVGIGVIGKLAAGSIYTGKFMKVDGTNGILNFGQPWTARPTRFRGYYQYTSAPINYASNDFKHLLNQPDSCHIYVLLTDWTAPFEIRTNPNNQHLLDFDSPSIIAYGGITTSQSSSDYIEFDIPLQYRATNRRPTYVLVCAAASKYGDYFTGGTGSTLYIDQLSFEYDY